MINKLTNKWWMIWWARITDREVIARHAYWWLHRTSQHSSQRLDASFLNSLIYIHIHYYSIHIYIYTLTLAFARVAIRGWREEKRRLMVKHWSYICTFKQLANIDIDNGYTHVYIYIYKGQERRAHENSIANNITCCIYSEKNPSYHPTSFWFIFL